MARTASKNAVKKIEAQLNSKKKKPRSKNNLKEKTTLRDMTVASIVADIDNSSTSNSVNVSSKNSNPNIKKASNKSTTINKKSSTTVKKTPTKNNNSNTKKTINKTTIKNSSGEKNTTVKRKTNNTKKVESKFQVLDDIISDLEEEQIEEKYIIVNDNKINEEEKQTITEEFDKDILDDKKNEKEKQDEEIKIEQSDKTLLDESKKKSTRKRRSNKFQMLEDPFVDDVDFDKIGKTTKEDIEEKLDNIDKKEAEDVLLEFEENINVKDKHVKDNEHCTVETKEKHYLKNNKLEDLEDNLRGLYDVGNDVVSQFHDGKEEDKKVKKSTIKPRVNKKKKKDVISYDDSSEENENDFGFSLLDYVSQRALNVFLVLLLIIFLLMCIAFVAFIIYISTV